MDKYILETDGSHYLNQTGIGGILYKNGEILDIFSAKIEDNTEDYEAYGILYGLQLAKKYGIDNIEVRNDGLNSIRYYNRTDKENDKDKKEIYKNVKSYAKNFSTIKFVHYKRERNKIADYFSTIYKNFPQLEFQEINNSGIFKNLKVLNFKHNKNFKTTTLLTSIISHGNKNILNIIRFDNKTGSYEIHKKELPLELSLEKMADYIYNEIVSIQSTEEIKLIINGKIAENIHFAVHGYKGLGKSIKTSFLELSPHWEEIKELNLLESSDKQKLKLILKDVYLSNTLDKPEKLTLIEQIKLNLSKNKHHDIKIITPSKFEKNNRFNRKNKNLPISMIGKIKHNIFTFFKTTIPTIINTVSSSIFNNNDVNKLDIEKELMDKNISKKLNIHKNKKTNKISTIKNNQNLSVQKTLKVPEFASLIIPVLTTKKRHLYKNYNIQEHFHFNAKNDTMNNMIVEVIHINLLNNERTNHIYKIHKNKKVYYDFLNKIFCFTKKRISFHMTGIFADDILKSIKNKEFVGEKNRGVFVKLLQQLDNQEQVLLSHNREIESMEECSTSCNTPVNKKLFTTKEGLIEIITVLGKDEYQIGDRLDIETYYKFPTEKRNNISEIQKKYFSRFIQLGLKEVSKTNSIDIIEDSKKELQELGVKLRF